MEPLEGSFKDLDASNKSFRLFALEEAIRGKASPELMKALLERQKVETDEECRLLLAHAIVSVRRKLEGTHQRKNVIDSDANFVADYEAADAHARMDIISNLPISLIPKLGPMAPDLLKKENHPVLAARLIRRFIKNWPAEHLSDLTVHLTSSSLCLRLSALEALSQTAPDLLIDFLPGLLTSPEPRTRALAVRGLTKIDMDEALAHLEALLLSSDPAHRLSGLQNCFLIPFDKVNDILIKYLASENDLELLERAGWLFESNPNVRAPYQLWEMAERATSEKAAVIKKMLAGACKILEDSGILGDGFKQYMERLQTWIHQRIATRYVQECIEHLSSLQGKINPEFEGLLVKNLQRPAIREAFENALTWPLPEATISLIRNFLNPAQRSLFASISGSDDTLEGLSHEDTVRKIAGWQLEDLPKVQPILTKVILNPDTPSDLCATALRTAIRLKVSGLTEVCEKLLRRNDHNLGAAALEYLGTFEPEKVLPLLGIYFQNPNPRMKVAVLKILKRFDTSQALMMLSAMLTSPDEERQSLALACMVNFDFSLIRDQLVEFLALNPAPRFLENGLCLFQANASPENLYSLFKVEKALPPKEANRVRWVRKLSEKALTNAGILKIENGLDSELKFEEHWNREQAKKASPKPAYALKSLDTTSLSPKKQEEKIQKYWGMAKTILMTFVIVFIFLSLIVPSPTSPKSPKKPQDFDVKKPGSALSSKHVKIQGTVLQKGIEGNGIMVGTQEGSTYLLFSDKSSQIALGDKIQTEVASCSKDAKGFIRAISKSFVIIK